MLEIKQVTLEGKYVLLRPPSINDLEESSSAAQDGEIWNNPYALFPTPKKCQNICKICSKKKNNNRRNDFALYNNT